jgi:hypothetical protein
MKKGIILVSLLTVMSCGLKITETVNDNVLLGKWTLEKIYCLNSLDAVDHTELFLADDVVTTELTIEGSRFEYTAIGACTTSSSGLYSTDFNGTSTGVLDFVEVATGGLTCVEVFTDSGINNVGTASITTTLSGLNSSDLTWLVSADRKGLELSYYSEFKGSAHVDGCEGACSCYAVFSKP